MKPSIFNICVKDTESGNFIIYNTHSTSIVSLNEEMYNSIFIDGNFSVTQSVQILKQNGFLVEDNEDELEKIYNIRRKVMSKNIQNIVILTTTKCNARCYYCFEKGIKPVDMTKETADSLIKFCKEKYKDKKLLVSWFGGEPLMNFDIVKYITERLTEEGYDLEGYITTNGSLITKEIEEYFSSHYREMGYQITLDAIGEKYGIIKQFVDIPVSKAFDRTFNNIKFLIDKGNKVLVRVNFLVSEIKKATELYSKIVHMFDGYDLKKVNIYMAPLSLPKQGENLCNCENYEKHPFLDMVDAHLLEKKVLQNFHSPDDESLLSKYNLSPLPLSCGIMMPSKIVVNANGDLYKCHRLVGKKEYSVGNVATGYDLDGKILNFFEAIELADDECKKCNLLPICQGGCKYMRITYGNSQKCCRIKQVKEELVLRYYNNLKKVKECKNGSN